MSKGMAKVSVLEQLPDLSFPVFWTEIAPKYGRHRYVSRSIFNAFPGKKLAALF